MDNEHAINPHIGITVFVKGTHSHTNEDGWFDLTPPIEIDTIGVSGLDSDGQRSLIPWNCIASITQDPDAQQPALVEQPNPIGQPRNMDGSKFRA